VNGKQHLIQADALSEKSALSSAASQEQNIVGKQLTLDWQDPALHDLLSDPQLCSPEKATKSSQTTVQKLKSSASSNQERSCALNQIERIHHLEQAIDQCQIYIHELKLQLVNQQFLKDQLAATEEISHIQQQAITALKAQLADLQVPETATQQTATWQEATLADQHAVAARQIELEQLKDQFEQEQVEAQAERKQLEQQVAQLQTLLEAKQQQAQALESQEAAAQRFAVNLTDQFETAQKNIELLQSHLGDRQATIIDLESQLQRSEAAFAAQQELLIALQQTQIPKSEKNQVIQGLSRKLLSAHTKIEALESEFSSQLMLQAKLQHSCQELEGQRDRDQNRNAQLEAQIAEMQEQILMQAQQASEYEAAVQHWKDQCLCAEHSVLQLKAVLEQLLKERHFSEMGAISSGSEASTEAGLTVSHSSESEPVSFLKSLKLDLPSFLRRHSKS